MMQRPSASLIPHAWPVEAIRRMTCALALLFLMRASVPQVTAMDLRPCPHEARTVTGTQCAGRADDSEASDRDREIAREEMERLHIISSSDNDRALRYGFFVIAPIFLLLVVIGFLRGA